MSKPVKTASAASDLAVDSPVSASGRVADRRDGRPRHLVPGGDEAVAAPLVRGALADGVDRGVLGAAALVDDDAAALADGQPGGARQLVARADAGREDQQIDVQLVAVGEPQRPHAAVLAGDDLLGRRRGVDLDAQVFDPPAQHRAARLVELQRHQPRRELDHVDLHPQLGERVGRLQPQEPAADDGADAARSRRRPVANRLQVLDRPVDEAATGVTSRDRRHEGRRAGGQHQPVVTDLLRLGRPTLSLDDHDAPLAIEPGRAGVQPDGEAGRLVLPGSGQRHLFGRAAVEEGREADAVVGQPRLLGDDRDLERRLGRVGLLGRARRHQLEEAVADHAVPDDDQPLGSSFLHGNDVSGASVS